MTLNVTPLLKATLQEWYSTRPLIIFGYPGPTIYCTSHALNMPGLVKHVYGDVLPDRQRFPATSSGNLITTVPTHVRTTHTVNNRYNINRSTDYLICGRI